MTEPTPLSLTEVEAEARRCRVILDEEPVNENSDMLYAAYNALLFALGYGVQRPSEWFGVPKLRSVEPETTERT